ncbi:MAG TPA: HmuY family protein [Phnomibacter sp.]|nr:HmuY family protein [Phnomibacter sp.]
MNISKVALTACVAVVAFTACTKDKTKVEQPLEVTTVTNLPADTTTGFSSTGRPIGNNAYTYYSLREKKIITGADTLTNKWDIAFKQFYIKVNGGTSSTGGNAAAAVVTSTFEDYKTMALPDNELLQDNGATFAINPMPGTWYTYNSTTFLALPVPGRIFVIRTADGRFAKMEITSFYRNGVTPPATATPVEKALAQFFYQFRFVFQPNGSKQF